MQDAVRSSLPTLSMTTQIDLACRDNLEFLQWLKRFWDSNYGGQPYDAVARRRGQSTDTPATIAPLAPARGGGGGGLSAGARSGGKTPVGGHRTGSSAAVHQEQVHNLQAQLKEVSAHLEGLEKERDFYFAKVRDLMSFLKFGFSVMRDVLYSSEISKY